MSVRAFAALALLGVALSGGAPARAQTPAYAASTSPDTALDVSVSREIELARSRGIPAEPLLAKVREGRLKRAPNPRIRVAVAALAARLDSARAALGARSAPDELVAGADALSAGATTAALRTIRAASPSRSVTAPLGALAQLVASGVPAPRAVSLILELLQRSATAAQVLAFGNAVESDAAGGVPAEESAVFRLHGFNGSAQGASATMSVGADQLNAAVSRPPSSSTPKRRP